MVPPVLPPKDLLLFTYITRHWGKGKHRALRGLLETRSELTLIPRDTDHSYNAPIR